MVGVRCFPAKRSDETGSLMIETIKKKIFASEPFRLLEGQALPTDPEAPLYIRGVSGSLMAFVASFLFDARKKQVTVLVADGDQAEQLRVDPDRYSERFSARFMK